MWEIQREAVRKDNAITLCVVYAHVIFSFKGQWPLAFVCLYLCQLCDGLFNRHEKIYIIVSLMIFFHMYWIPHIKSCKYKFHLENSTMFTSKNRAHDLKTYQEFTHGFNNLQWYILNWLFFLFIIILNSVITSMKRLKYSFVIAPHSGPDRLELVFSIWPRIESQVCLKSP